MAVPFATYADLEDVWRPLTPTEQSWAEMLIGAATRWITNPKRRPDLPAGDPDAKLVTLAVVKSALIAGEATGYTQFSKTVGPWSKSGTLVNPTAALVWEPWMLELLGISELPGPVYEFGGC